MVSSTSCKKWSADQSQLSIGSMGNSLLMVGMSGSGSGRSICNQQLQRGKLSFDQQVKLIRLMIMKCRQCSLDLNSERKIQFVPLCFIALLVFATITIVTILAFNPVILLNIAQKDKGQRDFIIKPKLQYFNTTKIAQLSPLTPMPRLKVDLIIGQSKKAVGWFIDFQLEERLGLGRMGSKINLNHSFIIAHKSLGLREGAEINVEFKNNSMLELIIELVQNKTIPFDNASNLVEEIQTLIRKGETIGGTFRVDEVFDNSNEKLGSSQVNNAILLDVKLAIKTMVQQTLGSKSLLMQFFTHSSFRISDIATEITINLPDRINIYSNPDYESVMRTIQDFGQKISKDIGLFAISMKMPIMEEMQKLQYFGMFIGVMLKSIIVSLFLLSTLMLDSSLNLSIEKQIVDLAILKVIGASRAHVGKHVLLGALQQVIYANIIAYPFAYLIFAITQPTVQELLGHKVQLQLSLEACAAGAFIGLFVPLFASISPINKIIHNNFVGTIGQSKQNYSQVKTEIYVEGQQFPWGKVTFGILATFYGLAIYYLLPKAMINLNLGLMITLFLIFLQGLLVGLIILSYSFQFLLQRAMSHVLLFWANSTDFALTVKNLSCHRLQNRKTSLIYALAVSFVIMIAVGFQLQLDATKDELLAYMGGDIDIGGPYVNPNFINKIVSQIPGVQSLTYVTSSLNQYFQKEGKGRWVLISDKAKLFFIDHKIYGVAGPFLKKGTTNGRQVIYTDAKSPHNIFDYLYTEAGINTCIISEYAANKMGLLGSDNREFYINIYYEDRVKRLPINYSSIINKRKGMYYSAFPFPKSEVAISFDTYIRLADIYNDQMPITRAKIYIKDLKQIQQIEDTINYKIRMNNEFNQDVSYVWTRQQTDINFDNIKRILNATMISLLIIVLMLCFFSLITSTHANIHSQQKQIGILLVLGYQKKRIFRIYIYEAFILLVNSCFKGFVVGYIVATFMAWQRELFSSATVNLAFNYKYVVIIFVMAAGSSILATYRQINIVVNRKISDLLIGSI